MFDWWFISFRDNEIDLEKFNVRVFWWNIHPILDKFKYLKIKDMYWESMQNGKNWNVSLKKLWISQN